MRPAVPVPGPNVTPAAYAPRVGTPFHVEPADVPEVAVQAVKRTLLRHADRDPLDDDLARLLVAMVYAAAAGDGCVLEEAASRYTLATGDVVVLQAAD